jgi:mRNA interferase RelE/StbE
MRIFQSRSFERKVKKFSKRQKLQLDEKFTIMTIQYLLAYRFVEEDLELIMIGPHENYYRDLKKYLKST